MRFFIVKSGAAVVEKLAFSGDESAADGLIAQYRVDHPTLTVSEVDQSSFDSTSLDAAMLVSKDRTAAINKLLTDPSPESKFIRAVLLTILDEINVIRALLPGPPPQRTAAQMKTAIQAKINAGSAD